MVSKKDVFSKNNVYFFEKWQAARKEREENEKFSAEFKAQDKVFEDVWEYLERTKTPVSTAREGLMNVIMKKLLPTNPFRDPTPETVRAVNADYSFLLFALIRIEQMKDYYSMCLEKNGYYAIPWTDDTTDQEIAQMREDYLAYLKAETETTEDQTPQT